MSISSEGEPLARLALGMVVGMEMRTSGMKVDFALHDFSIEDQFTSRPITRYIIASQDQIGGGRDAHGNIQRAASITQAGSRSRQRMPQCRVTYETKGNDSFVEIDSAPLEITWNEMCIQKVIAVFVSGPTTGVVTNPQIIEKMNKFAAEVSLPTTGSMNVKINISAPKIVIPENSETDKGCLLLDSGELEVKGQVNPLGINFNVSLHSVNVGMPVTMKLRHAQVDPDTKLYLVEPFHIDVGVQNADKTVADMTVAVAITKFCADLDVVKITRILRCVNIVSNTVNAAFAEANSRNDENGDLIVDLDLASNFTRLDLVDLEEASKEAKAHQDLTKLSMDIVVALPKVEARLQLGGAHQVVLEVMGMDAHLQQRLYDMDLDFKLDSIGLKDSLRPHPHDSIILTPRAPVHTLSPSSATRDQADAPRLIHLTYLAINDKASPSYHGYATEISFEFSRLELSVDEDTVLRLKPFLTDLMTGLANVQEESVQQQQLMKSVAYMSRESTVRSSMVVEGRSSSTSRATGVGQKVANTERQPLKISSKLPIGMVLRCSVDSVKLILMRNVRGGSDDQPRAGDGQAQARQLEEAYGADLEQLAVDVDMVAFNTTKVRLKSFSIVDRRPESENYCHRELLCRSTFASTNTGSRVGGIAGGDVISRGDIDEVDAITPETGMLLSRATTLKSSGYADDKDKILTVVYEEQGKGQSTVKVVLRDVTSFLSVDSVLDLTDVALKNVNAVLEMLKAFQAAAPPAASPAPKTDNRKSLRDGRESGRETSVSKRPSVKSIPRPNGFDGASEDVDDDNVESAFMSVSVSVSNPRLFLLEDPARNDTDAVVAQCGIHFTYVTDTRDTRVLDTRETMHLSLQQMETFVTNLAHDVPQQIVEPTGIEFHMNRRHDNGIVLSCSISLEVDSIISKVSLKDIILANKIISRAQGHPITSSPKPQSPKEDELHSLPPSSVASGGNVLGDGALGCGPVSDNDVDEEEDLLNPDGAFESEEIPSRPDITMFDIMIQFRVISIIGVDDYHGQSRSVLRFNMDELSLRAQGVFDVSSLETMCCIH